MNHRDTGACLLFAMLLVSAPAGAQLASDDVPHVRTLPLNEQVRQQLQSSRWRIGAMRVQPSFALQDLGYENNVFGTPTDPVSDWRSTVAAGARLLVPIGPKTYFRSAITPSYTYYQKLVNRRSFGGDYGASLLGLYNHMSIEADANAFRGTSPVSSEEQRAALGTRTDGSIRAEVDLLRRLSVFGVVHGQRQRYTDTADDLSRGLSLRPLERNESVTREGVRYRFASYLDFSVAAEKTRTTFLADDSKDNTTNAALLGVHYDRVRSFLNFSVGTRTGEARNIASRFQRFRTMTGSYFASHELAARILVSVYGRRGVGYSLTAENPYFIETSNGLGLTVPLGHRIGVQGFGEVGKNSYPNLVGSIKRVDDLHTVGGGLVVHLYRRVGLVTSLSRTSYASNLPGADRSLVRLTSALTFGGDLFQ